MNVLRYIKRLVQMGFIILGDSGIKIIVSYTLAIQINLINTTWSNIQAGFGYFSIRSGENRTKHRGRIAFRSESTKSTGNIAIYPVIPFFTSSYHIRRTSEISNLHLRENSRLPCGNIKTDIAYHRESNKITSLSQRIQIYPTNLFTIIHIESCKP